MATITTFSTLKTAVGDWLDRTDMDAVGGPIDTMISMCEAELYRDFRLSFMETALSVVIGSGVAALPADFLELKIAYISGSPIQPLQPKNGQWIYENYIHRSSSGRPQFIGTQGTDFIFGPYPDSAYTLTGTYYALPTDLSTSNETNWLTTNAPDLLLNGTLLQSVGYLGADERAPYWRESYQRAFDRIVASDDRERFPSEMGLTVVTA